jgi:enolase-phosphatase E1
MGVFTNLEDMVLLTSMMQLSPAAILFLSDNVKEVEAAIAAGMKSLVVDRPGNAVLSVDDQKRFEVVDTFEKIRLA